VKISKILAPHILFDQRPQGSLVFTNGCFDLLHVGHLRLLEFAKSQGDLLLVAINSDASVRRLKGPTRPLRSLEERCELIAGFSVVDIVTWFEEETPLLMIQQLMPQVLIKGGDWSLDQLVGAKEVQSSGGKVIRFPYIQGRSTTALVQQLHGDRAWPAEH
jgi:rfaE bifunctional protein nucleotidyltransferase chain/domain